MDFGMSVTATLKLTDSPMSEASSPRSTVTIKKYANRRLYNTATSSYVTLESLSAMVKKGIEFNVYDAKTSEDITRSVLTQIIVEEEGKTGQPNLLPISFLRQLIGFYGDNMQWLVPKYLEHSMEMLANNQEQLSHYFHSAFGNMFPFGGALEEMSKQNIAMFERAMRLFSPFVSAESAATDKPTLQEKEPPEESFLVRDEPESLAPVNVEPQAKPVPVACAVIEEIPAPVKSAPAVVPPAPAAAPVVSTPMPHVQSAAIAAVPGADDMQQKIANLQRQLAELAKKGA